MTCIVAVKKDGIVYMGGDSASVDTYSLFSRKVANPKVFKNGPYLIGYTSSFRMGQLLEHKIALPEPKDNLMHFMCTEFIDTIRQGLKDNGYSRIDSNQEKGGNFLVALQNRIFEIQDDFQVNEFTSNYGSCGCGREYALAVCYTLYDYAKAEDLITRALEAASEFSIGVRPPFTIIKNNT